MSQRALTIAVAVSLLIGVLWYVSSKDEKGPAAESIGVEQLDSPAPPAQRVSQPSSASSRSTSGAQDPASVLNRGYRWNPSHPGIAASEADAKWLDQHGFPGPDVEMHLRSLPMHSLRDLANSGNQAAQSILAYRSAEGGAPRADVLTLLSESAKAGSVYALKTYGDIHLMVEGYQDPVLANAYYMLQARAGDQAGFVQAALTDYHLDPTQRLRARLLEQALWKGMQLSSLGESPVRPGYQDFLDKSFSADDQGVIK